MRHAQRDRASRAAVGVFEVDHDSGVVVATRRRAGTRAAGAPGLAAEHRREEVAEVGLLARTTAAAAAELEAAVPARRRLEVLPALLAPADVVVRGTLFRVAQRFVGLGHFLEARFGVGLLADIGVVFAGELAVGALDLVGRGAALHTEGCVVVLEFHECCRLSSPANGRPARGAANLIMGRDPASRLDPPQAAARSRSLAPLSAGRFLDAAQGAGEKPTDHRQPHLTLEIER